MTVALVLESATMQIDIWMLFSQFIEWNTNLTAHNLLVDFVKERRPLSGPRSSSTQQDNLPRSISIWSSESIVCLDNTNCTSDLVGILKDP